MSRLKTKSFRIRVSCRFPSGIQSRQAGPTSTFLLGRKLRSCEVLKSFALIFDISQRVKRAYFLNKRDFCVNKRIIWKENLWNKTKKEVERRIQDSTNSSTENLKTLHLNLTFSCRESARKNQNKFFYHVQRQSRACRKIWKRKS
jgi:hypothetical protein